MPVCLFACFCGLNPRTVPQLSLIKYRAPRGNRGLVLGLNVSYLYRSLGTSSGARAEQTRLSGSRRHNYVTKNCRPQTPSTGLRHPSWSKVPGNDALSVCWPFLDTCFCACSFSFSFVLAVAVDAT